MQQGTFHIALGRRRLSRMVGLNRSSGYQHVSAGFNGIADQELEFSGLVSTTLQAGQVVSFNPELRTMQLLAKVFSR